MAWTPSIITNIVEKVTAANKAFFENIREGIEERKAAEPYSVLDYGAKGDGKRLATVTSNSASAEVTVPSASFTSGDVGKLAVVYNDTEAGTIRTIEQVLSGTKVKLSGTAGLTLAAAGYIAYASDDKAAFEACLAAAKPEGTSLSLGFNQPIGLGQAEVLIPTLSGDGFYGLSGQVTVPPGVIVDAPGMSANMQASRTAPVLVFSPYTTYHRLYLECLFGAGVQLGEAAGVQADIHGGTLVLWHVGKAEAEGLVLAGTGYLLDLVWMKGGKRGVYMNAGSDCRINTLFLIGAVEAIRLVKSNQVHIGKAILDSCGLKEEEGTTNGVNIEEGCSDIDIAVQAFEVTGIAPARKMAAVVAVGAVSATNNVDLRIKVQAQLTGGVALELGHAQDVIFDVLASNTASASSGGSNMTAAVKYGTVAGSCIGQAAINSSIKAYEGTLQGTLTYTRSGVKYSVSGGAAPGVAYASGAGTGPPSSPKAVEATGQSGIVEWGTGTATTTGAQVAVTFNDTTGYLTTPKVVVTALNTATAALQPYVSAPATTGFNVGLGSKPAESQGATTYRVAYAIVG